MSVDTRYFPAEKQSPSLTFTARDYHKARVEIYPTMQAAGSQRVIYSVWRSVALHDGSICCFIITTATIVSIEA